MLVDGNDSGEGKMGEKNTARYFLFPAEQSAASSSDEPSFLLHLFDVIIVGAMLIYTVLWLFVAGAA